MKLTESKLKQLVNEEIAAMIDEGEIDEGIFSGLGKLAKKTGAGIKAAGKAIAKTYKTGSLTGDLNLGIKYLTQVIAKAEKNMELVPEEQRQAYKKALSGIKGGVTNAKKASATLAAMEE